jgi:hypothetical protein
VLRGRGDRVNRIAVLIQGGAWPEQGRIDVRRTGKRDGRNCPSRGRGCTNAALRRRAEAGWNRHSGRAGSGRRAKGGARAGQAGKFCRTAEPRETRIQVLAFLGKRLHAAVVTIRSDALHVISFRRANRKEVKWYEQERG